MAYPFQSTGLFGRPSKRSPDRPRRRVGPTRWFWRSPRRIARPNLGHERLVFDPLEPRLLLNADVLTINLAHDAGPQPVDHNLIVQLVQQTEQVNNQAVSVQRVQVVDQSNNNAVLAFGDLSDISAISIQTGAGNTSLTIDAKSFAGQTAPAISFDGGSGQNNIIFDNSTPTNWSLTGQNSGTVSGNGVTASFQNVANLTGAATSNDTLTVQQGGSLSGTFDGSGGNDSLVFDNGPHQAAAYTIGSQSSTITLDGQSLTFAGLESVDIGDPLSFSLVSSPNVHAELSQSGTNLVLSGTSFTTLSAQPDANTPFTLTLGSGDTLQVDTLDFSQMNGGADAHSKLVIDGNGASIDFTGNVTDSAGISATVTTQVTGSASTTGHVQSIGAAGSALRADASITVDTGVVLTGSTITLEAQSTSTSTITSASTDTGAGIYTENSAQITINGNLNATGTLSVLTNVNLTDDVNATTRQRPRRHHRRRHQHLHGDAGRRRTGERRQRRYRRHHHHQFDHQCGGRRRQLPQFRPRPSCRPAPPGPWSNSRPT